MCVLCSLAAVWCWCVLCFGLFELLESKPIVAVKVLLDGPSRAKRGYAETLSAAPTDWSVERQPQRFRAHLFFSHICIARLIKSVVLKSLRKMSVVRLCRYRMSVLLQNAFPQLYTPVDYAHLIRLMTPVIYDKTIQQEHKVPFSRVHPKCVCIRREFQCKHSLCEEVITRDLKSPFVLKIGEDSLMYFI